ncbi:MULTISPECIES: cytochrome c oxidase subunit II [unclassified Leptolyngbya]|uniref:cytochrome c oxidase subunit II n=1 Tax=unclassified Leptolyngbya TaxID=2650499 RepID=UPI0016853558|nr:MULTISPECIES: cytochrome c oxidase subunit II [unclassified Leptolyngbya]MBD1911860.1 cytochrome c oxidase subunit II [Leptolyngbya sp. FACHB-8]MBD2156069.1 cytochrome c oxidase subunit II [Leptolyngbya sp. FACHB-16]
MMKLRAAIIMTLYAIFAAFVSFWMAKQSYSWFPPEAASESKLVDDLFSLFTGLGTFIYLGVIGPFFYSLIFHRAEKYDMSDGPPIEGNTALEVIWTAIPIVLVLTLSWVSYQTYEKMAIRGPMELVHLHTPSLIPAAYADPFDSSPQKEIQSAAEKPIENIEVLARQWAWVFRYPEADITSTELHLPIDRRIHFTLHSEDVLHGFYIPAFRLKQDVVPNHDIEMELTPTRAGTYRLRDSMFSGTYFAANQADVVVQPLEEYEQWLADAASRELTTAYNPAIAEYTRRSAIVKGWDSIAPAPPPEVNYAPPTKQPTSPPA